MTRGGRAAALTVLLALTLPPGATAADVTAGQLHALAVGAAAGAPTALAQLRAVTSVDGRPARIAASLNTGDPAELHSRLVSLAAGTGPAASTPASAHAQQTAAAILEANQYGTAPVPDPVGSALRGLGSALSKLAAGAPGGPAAFWVIVGTIALALFALGARRMMRRLDPVAQAAAAAARSAGEDPDTLEHAAQAAEEDGAFADAVRLRFRAGLLRLSARRVIDYRPSLLTADIARRVRSAEFDALAATFDRVAYSGAPAVAGDAAAAREGWRTLLATEIER